MYRSASNSCGHELTQPSSRRTTLGQSLQHGIYMITSNTQENRRVSTLAVYATQDDLHLEIPGRSQLHGHGVPAEIDFQRLLT